jgi:hypothetical protein
MHRQILELIAVAILAISSLVFLVLASPIQGRTYNCSIAEISPDYPIKVKEECRKLRAGNFNKDLQTPK